MNLKSYQLGIPILVIVLTGLIYVAYHTEQSQETKYRNCILTHVGKSTSGPAASAIIYSCEALSKTPFFLGGLW